MAAIDPRTEDHPPAQPEYEDPVAPTEYDVSSREGEDDPDGSESNLPPIVDPDGEIEALEDRSAPVKRRLWSFDKSGTLQEIEYEQKGLMWFGKLELYGLLGQAVKVVLEGDNPLGIDSMLGIARDPRQMINDLMGVNNLPGADTSPDRADREADQMELEAGKLISALAQVVSMAPELISQAYCIALAIPKAQRPWAVNWAFPNMDDEMGKDILHTFIDQNWGVMEEFFTVELPKIIKRIVMARTKASAGRP